MTDLFFPKKKKNVALLVTAHRSSMNLNVPWSLDVLGYFNEIRFWTYLDSKNKEIRLLRMQLDQSPTENR